MSLLGKSVNVTRCNVAVPAQGPGFEAVRFVEIEPDSEVRERIGVIPFELDSPYEIGAGRYAFRVRIDRRTPDPTAVRERVRELIRAELEATGAPFLGPKRRKALKALAEQELLVGLRPKSSIVECAIDGAILYVGSTSKAHLGAIFTVLRGAGVEASLKAPWLDAPSELDDTSDILSPKEPGQSVLGCRFLKALLEDPEVLVEPEAGNVRLVTREAKVTLAEGVLNDLYDYVEKGAEILSAKLIVGAVPLRFDALSYRISGMKLEPATAKAEHWTVEMDVRLARIAEVWEMLDTKYAAWVTAQVKAE